MLPSFDYDLTDEEAVIRFYGEVLGGQREAALISKRSKRAHLEEAQNGKRHSGGKRAFGERGRRRVEDADGTWRTVPAVSEEQAEAERELIREAARRILAGDSLRGICLDWNEAGHRVSPRRALDDPDAPADAAQPTAGRAARAPRPALSGQLPGHPGA